MPPFQWLPTWETIKRIGGSRIVATASLFPFVGYLVVANEQAASLFTLIVDGINGEALSDINLIIYRLREVYLGLVLLSAGVILYKLFCPPQIKNFETRFEFYRMEHMITNPVRIGSQAEGLSGIDAAKWFLPASVFEAISDAQATQDINNIQLKSITIPEVNSKTKTINSWRDDDGISISKIINAHYDQKNYSMWFVRLLCSFLFFSGYFVLGRQSILVLIDIILF
jgi:hypothetical protein